MRVLVVEDHAKLALTVSTVLRSEGMAVDVTSVPIVVESDVRRTWAKGT